MGVRRGGKEPFHIKDKFLDGIRKEDKMGSWGITERQGEEGLDLLGTAAKVHLPGLPSYTASHAKWECAPALPFYPFRTCPSNRNRSS